MAVEVAFVAGLLASNVNAPSFSFSFYEYESEYESEDEDAALVNRRVEVWCKGKGTVIDIKKSPGKAPKYVILFDNGARETLLLSKDGGGKSFKFELLQ